MRSRHPSRSDLFLPSYGTGFQSFGHCGPPSPRPWALIVAAIAFFTFVAGGVTWYLTADNRLQPTAPEPVHTAILCDVSNVTTAQQDQLRRIIVEELPLSFHRSDRVIVGSLAEKTQLPMHLLFTGEDTGSSAECTRSWLCTPGVENKRRAEQFLAPFNRAAHQCMEPRSLSQKPLVEAINVLSRHQDFAGRSLVARRRLILITDANQHTPGGASIHELQRIKDRSGKWVLGGPTLFTPAGKAYVARHIGGLLDTEVLVLLIRRPEEVSRQDYRLREWLERYLADSGARVPVQIREIW